MQPLRKAVLGKKLGNKAKVINHARKAKTKRPQGFAPLRPSLCRGVVFPERPVRYLLALVVGYADPRAQVMPVLAL